MRKILKVTDPILIAEFIKESLPRENNFTLTAVVVDEGYEVGIADDGVRGFTPTGLIVDKPRYDDASDIVDEANLILFPQRSKIENAKIQLSTMRM